MGGSIEREEWSCAQSPAGSTLTPSSVLNGANRCVFGLVSPQLCVNRGREKLYVLVFFESHNKSSDKLCNFYADEPNACAPEL